MKKVACGLVVTLILTTLLSVTGFADSAITLPQDAAIENTQPAPNPAPVAPVYPPEGETSIFDDFEKIDKENFIALIDNKKIEKVIQNGNTGFLYFVTIEGDKYFYEDSGKDITPYLTLNNIEIEMKAVPTTEQKEAAAAAKQQSDNWSNFMLALMISGGVFFVCFRAYKVRTPMPTSTGPSQPTSSASKEDVPKVKFSDVEGVEGLKNDVMRVVDSLKHPEKYTAMGARPTKGIILYGPPGTGKTLLAKAIAGEAGVPFFSAVGSDFVEKYVGVGASRVRDLYKKARKNAPCIVFIDEVDAVAAKRGDENNSEADQTINALLSELDGFTSSSGIVTICATNRLDLLDNAFKRAGRFDLKLAVGLPDKKGRLKILEIHGKNKKFAEEIDLRHIAGKTVGFSGAELESLLNEAALIAVDKQHESIMNEDIDDAFFKIIMQGNKLPREEANEMNKLVAWHEAGHTLATKLLTDDEVTSVTIVGSTSGAGGVTIRNPKETGLHSKKYLRNLIKVMYAGRAAEEIYLRDTDKITTGASQDIQQATGIIKQYLGLYGMGDIGMIDLTQFGHDLKDIREEASGMAKELYDETVMFLKTNRKKLRALAVALIEKETLNEDEIDKIIKEN